MRRRLYNWLFTCVFRTEVARNPLYGVLVHGRFHPKL